MARKDEILKLRKMLLTRRDALRQALAGDLSALKELRDQSSGDVVDFALDSAQDEINSRLAEVESRELAQIDKALEKMRTGKYGICEGTGRPIPLTRLKALPYAQYSIEAQREIEKYGHIDVADIDWGKVTDEVDADLSIDDIELDVT
ncbi:MAG: TraR/DksA family transcriptional regulator [Pirellulales bacterium]|nr:TraR/DksA family transcriptional regulator [Pirellulales bacterium]